MIRAGIIGGSGYTGGELIRLLLNHPEVHLDFVYSRTREGLTLHSTFPDLIGHTDLKYTSQPKTDVDVVFLCLGHGNSGQFLQKWVFDPGTRIIDLSNEFRLKGTADYKGRSYLYGLPEHQAEQISKARFIANPGCFATGITLALLPLSASPLRGLT